MSYTEEQLRNFFRYHPPIEQRERDAYERIAQLEAAMYAVHRKSEQVVYTTASSQLMGVEMSPHHVQAHFDAINSAGLDFALFVMRIGVEFSGVELALIAGAINNIRLARMAANEFVVNHIARANGVDHRDPVISDAQEPGDYLSELVCECLVKARWLASAAIATRERERTERDLPGVGGV